MILTPRHTLAALATLTLLAGAACSEGRDADENTEGQPAVSAESGTPMTEAREERDDEEGEEGEEEGTEALQREARVTEAAARATALAAVPGGVVEKYELEREDGKLIYSYDIRTAGKSGIDEVHVDAISGAVISNQHETPEDEAKEAAEDAAKAGGT
ncbi:MAG: PepSY domain-containing protein [Gemmatimonadetes bacterium]|nr:PepSY domain-containing protein [Gemmatimonadota bacterium]HPF61449.1 PepSY domain-containing protein [Gemmatimonadales bacterium]HRX19137.1 PepSY domain-containing protein [Gemmatimonadales bacterium]